MNVQALSCTDTLHVCMLVHMSVQCLCVAANGTSVYGLVGPGTRSGARNTIPFFCSEILGEPRKGKLHRIGPLWEKKKNSSPVQCSSPWCVITGYRTQTTWCLIQPGASTASICLGDFEAFGDYPFQFRSAITLPHTQCGNREFLPPSTVQIVCRCCRTSCEATRREWRSVGLCCSKVPSRRDVSEVTTTGCHSSPGCG